MTTSLPAAARPAGLGTRRRSLAAGAPRQLGPRWVFQQALRRLFWAYLRLGHDFRVRYHPGIPQRRPYIAVINHTSALDVAALVAADPFDPPTVMIVKREMVQQPVIGWILRQWGAVGVDRRGRDVAALRQIRRLFEQGRGICIAPSGTRSPDGRLGPVSPVLVRLIAQAEVAVFPVAIVGGRECLPKGALLPRPGPIWIDTGPEIDLRPFRGRQLSEAELEQAGRLIRDAIAALLPAGMQPDPAAPVLGAYTV
jgi:1-acyl-sn-glycerol-3-phosphate acyltransferase